MSINARKTIRIGAGQGFYGDTATAAIEMARHGDVGYMAFDVLSELTLALLEKDRELDPSAGYVRDLIPTMRRLLPFCAEKNVRLITNAGGLDPRAASSALLKLAHGLGLDGLRVGTVTGDDLSGRMDDLVEQGVEFRHLVTGESPERIRDDAVFACAYLGAGPIVEALNQGADVVITGRVADSSLFLAPAVHAFGWKWDDWDHLAIGSAMGHVLECAGQSTGGNFSGDWAAVPEPWALGYPLAEIGSEGSLVITKPPGSGGLVTPDTIADPLLHEIHDPSCYLDPDVTVDLSRVTLEADGPDRVSIRHVHGRPRPDTLKVLLGYIDGWVGEGRTGYCWPDALAKARRAEEIMRRRFQMAGIRAEEIVVEYQGLSSLNRGLLPCHDADPPEVWLRIAVRTRSREDAERVAREFPYLTLNGPPGVAAAGRISAVRELMGIWPSAVPRGIIEKDICVEVKEVRT